jgi:hypothetical protein
MTAEDRPQVVRLPRSRFEPAAIAFIAIVALVGVAIWKPWVSGPSANATALPLLPTSGEPGFAGVASPTVDVAGLGSTPIPLIAGLDFSSIGLVDPAEEWGVAAAYVQVTDVAVAARTQMPSVEPSLDWSPVVPGGSVRLAHLPNGDHPAIATVALAATWPAGPLPTSVRLYYRGALLGAATRPGVAREVGLLRPLPLIVRLATGTGRAHFYPSESLAWERLSGVFFLPPTGPMPTAPAGWLRSGWPAGAYEFRVDDMDGTTSRLPFILEGEAGTPLP